MTSPLVDPLEVYKASARCDLQAVKVHFDAVEAFARMVQIKNNSQGPATLQRALRVENG